MAKEYDVIVIGTGTAGSSSAYRCREAGLSVAIIDYRPFGGTCALRGCDPKKVLVGATEIVERSLAMKGKGILEESKIDWVSLIRFKRGFTDPIPDHSEKGFSEAGIDTFHGNARFKGKNGLEVNNETINGKYIVIATGAKPAKLNIPGEEYVITSDQFLELDKLPSSIIFIGGGYISFEFAHIAARAGSKVKILHRSVEPLKKFDPDLVNMLVKASQENGIDIRLNMPITSIEKRGEKFIAHGGKENSEEFEAELVVNGGGRVPDIEDLDLEKAEIKFDKGISINKYLQSVSNPSIYVAGDANAYGIPLTPVTVLEGNVAAKNIIEKNTSIPDYTAVPSVVFTTPPLASVGMHEEEARMRGLNYRINYQDTSSWYSSRRINLKHSGFKVIIEKDTDRILGAHILGHNSDEIINIFAIAIRLNITASKLKDIIWAYPTNSSDISYMV